MDTPTVAAPGHRYHVEGLLGEGGFGRVYRARLEADGAFHKEVALKVLNDPDPPKGLLKRFRDEARILALVRDRAIVGVDPPLQVGGRWVLVMELCDGYSAEELVRQHGRLPAGAALEVVGEVARVLDKVWRAPGPDGRPLRLLHRDIKPDNVQITQSGEVKLLDFGIARADFEGREYQTRKALGGTPGFIAPERLFGREGPEGDVYSLGVTLHVLLTGRRPDEPPPGPAPPEARATVDLDRIEAAPEGDPDLADALALAARMHDPDPDARPVAREVEQRCRELRTRAVGPWLRDWAEGAMPERRTVSHTGWAGEMITLTRATGEGVPVAAAPARGQPWLAAAALGTFGLGLAAVVALSITIGLRSGRALSELPPAPEAPVLAAPAPIVPPVPVALPPEVPVPVPEVPAPEVPAPEVPAAPPPAPAAVPAPSPPEAPAPAAATWEVVVVSRPLGAEVTVDGRRVGQTPLRLALPGGRHLLHATAPDGTTSEREIRVGTHAPARHAWDIGANQWEAGY